MEKRYRPNVAAIVLSSKYPEKCEFFLGKRSDLNNVWQFPQGGIDEGEEPKDALFRELQEEIGTNAVEIIASYPDWIKYDFPPIIAKKMYPFDGQVQRYYLVRLKSGAKIDLDTHEHVEFEDYTFSDLSEVVKTTTHFKKPVYKKVLKYFQKEGFI
ncbi:MAG: RNA pyrophosphohydrolase [Campylobacterota bacterium]